MKQVKGRLVRAVLFIVLFSIVLTTNVALAFDMETAAPNNMTPEMSRQIHLEKQFIKAVMIAIPAIIISLIVIKVVKAGKKVQASASTTKKKR